MRPEPIVSTPRRAAILVAVGAFLAIAGYTASVALPLLEGPSLTVRGLWGETPEIATIEGFTERVSFLSVNGKPIPLNEDGSFTVERAYPPGYTAITITAIDRFGRELERIIPLLN